MMLVSPGSCTCINSWRRSSTQRLRTTLWRPPTTQVHTHNGYYPRPLGYILSRRVFARDRRFESGSGSHGRSSCCIATGNIGRFHACLNDQKVRQLAACSTADVAASCLCVAWRRVQQSIQLAQQLMLKQREVHALQVQLQEEKQTRERQKLEVFLHFHQHQTPTLHSTPSTNTNNNTATTASTSG